MAGDVYFFEGNQIIAVCEGLKFQKIKRTILDLLMPSSIQAAPAAPAIRAPANESTSSSDRRVSRTRTAAAHKPVESTKSTGAPSASLLSNISPLQNDFDTILEAIASEVGVDVAEIGEDIAFVDLGVDSLVLIDAPSPGALPPPPLETIALLEKVGAFDGMKEKKKGGMIRDGVRAHFAGSVGVLRRYRPGAMARGEAAGIRSVAVVWARRGVWETVGEEVRERYCGRGEGGGGNKAGDWIMDPRVEVAADGWDVLLPGAGIRCESVEGDHFGIMRRPGVAELGGKLDKALGL